MSSARAAMLHEVYRPTGPLARWVQQIWHVGHAAPAYHLERVLPMGRMQIIVTLRDEPLRVYDPLDTARVTHYRGALVSGVQRGCTVIDTEQQASIMGAVLRPVGGPPLLGLPASDFVDAHVELEDIHGAAARDLQHALREASDVQQRFALFEAALAGWLHASGTVRSHPAVTGAVALSADAMVPARCGLLAAHGEVSPRHLTRLFRDEVGVTPKQFLRIERFQRAVTGLNRNRAGDLGELALGCGYADQAHFNREFRALSGITPVAYRKVARPDMNHVPLQPG